MTTIGGEPVKWWGGPSRYYNVSRCVSYNVRDVHILFHIILKLRFGVNSI